MKKSSFFSKQSKDCAGKNPFESSRVICVSENAYVWIKNEGLLSSYLLPTSWLGKLQRPVTLERKVITTVPSNAHC